MRNGQSDQAERDRRYARNFYPKLMKMYDEMQSDQKLYTPIKKVVKSPVGWMLKTNVV